MSKNYAVAHVTKYNASSFSSGTMSAHIDREHIPRNARKSDQDKNFELVSSPGQMREDIQKRIEEGYTGKRAVRKDAVISCGVIFSGSHEQMQRIEDAGLIEDWARDTYQYACEEWGVDNIIRATVHLDEHTPHMHLHFVPLTEDGKLSAKKIISKDRLKKLQDDYSKKMEEYGLKRGLEGSENRHITTKQYYQRKGSIKEEAKVLANDPDTVRTIEELLEKIEELTGEKKKSQTIDPDKPNHYETIERREDRGESIDETKQSRTSKEGDRGEREVLKSNSKDGKRVKGINREL